MDGVQTVTKSEFARLTEVSPGRVTQWISERKIDGDAIVGEGRDARIRPDLACEQLKRRINVGQRFGNGLSTKLAAAPPPSLPLELPTAPAPMLSPSDAVEEQIKRARLETIERTNRKLAEEEAARAGRYMSAATVTQEMGRLSAQMVSVFEGSLSEFATAIAAKFEIPQRDVLHLLRGEFRQARARAAVSLRQAAAELPAQIEDDTAPAEPEPPVED